MCRAAEEDVDRGVLRGMLSRKRSELKEVSMGNGRVDIGFGSGRDDSDGPPKKTKRQRAIESRLRKEKLEAVERAAKLALAQCRPKRRRKTPAQFGGAELDAINDLPDSMPLTEKMAAVDFLVVLINTYLV